jgi:hypothetical protein
MANKKIFKEDMTVSKRKIDNCLKCFNNSVFKILSFSSFSVQFYSSVDGRPLLKISRLCTIFLVSITAAHMKIPLVRPDVL